MTKPTIDYHKPETLRQAGIYDEEFFHELWPACNPKERTNRENILINNACHYLNIKENNQLSFTNKAQNDLLGNILKHTKKTKKSYYKMLESEQAFSKIYGGLEKQFDSLSSYQKKLLMPIFSPDNGMDRKAFGELLSILEKAIANGLKIERVREGGELGAHLLIWVNGIKKNWNTLGMINEFSLGKYYPSEKGKGVRANDTPYTLLKLIKPIDDEVTFENIETALRKTTG